MFGTGLLKGLGVTMKHFMGTYIDDLKAIPSRYASGQDFIRQLPDEQGIFTIQYPEEKRQLPERFRYIPMLIYDTPKGEDRCTACGICPKVCPPQCIWIVRDQDEKGKPIPRAAEFYIDASICMSCGFCAEFCPFDAIKMNHDYELAVYERYPNLVYDMKELTVPLEYYAALYPTQFAEEEARRAEEEAKKAAKAARRGADKATPAAKAETKPAAKAEAATVQAAPAQPAPAAPVAEKKEVAQPAPIPKPAAAAPAQPAAAGAAAFGKQLSAKARTSGKLSFEELESRRAEAYTRYKDRKGADAKVLHVGAAVAAAGVAAAAAEPVAEVQPAAEAEASAVVEAAPEVKAEAPAAKPAPQAEAPAAPAAAAGPAEGGRFPWPASAHSSGTLSWDELERRRAEAHARYRERKGGDAKILSEYVK